MSRYVWLSFLVMGLAFYELSGGSDFKPPQKVAAGPSLPNANAVASSARPAPVQVASLDSDAVFETATFVKSEDQNTPAPSTATPAAQVPVQTSRKPTLVSLGQSTTHFAQPLTSFVPASVVVASADGNVPLIDTSSDETKDIRKVTGRVVNLRKGPSTDHGVITKLNRGTEVEILDQQDGWVELRSLNGGRVGWMSAELVSR